EARDLVADHEVDRPDEGAVRTPAFHQRGDRLAQFARRGVPVPLRGVRRAADRDGVHYPLAALAEPVAYGHCGAGPHHAQAPALQRDLTAHGLSELGTSESDVSGDWSSAVIWSGVPCSAVMSSAGPCATPLGTVSVLIAAGIVISSESGSDRPPSSLAKDPGGVAGRAARPAGEISRATVVSSALPSADAHRAAQVGSWVSIQAVSRSRSSQAMSLLNEVGHSSSICALP